VGALALGVRFALELVLLVALAWWGFTADAPTALRVAFGLAAPAAALLVWGRWIAPRAERRLDDPPRFVLETLLWLAGARAAMQVWGTWWGVAFLVLALATAVSVRFWPEPVHGGRGRTAS
jgi:Protein of unknown function (DUF2568)